MKFKIKLLMFVLILSGFNKAVVEFVPGLKALDSLITLTGDLIIAFLGITCLARAPGKMQASIAILLVISSFNFLSGDVSLVSHLNGLREFLNIFFLFIFFHQLFKSGFHYYFNYLFRYFVLAFLFLQIPSTFLQFKQNGAGDFVGGTLGTGASGVLSLSIFILVYYLVENRFYSEGSGSKLRYLLFHSFFFIPVFLNETKITFILIPILFASFINFRKVSSLLGAGVIGVLFLFAFASLYSDRGTKYENSIEAIYNKDFLNKYLADQPDKGLDVDVPRFRKIILGTQLLADSKPKLLLGQEYGAFKGGTTLSVSPFGLKYNWLLRGSRPYLFYLLINGGIMLVLLISYLLIQQIRNKPYPAFKNYSKGMLTFLAIVFVMMLFYNDAFRYQPFTIFFIYSLFFAKYFRPALTTSK